MIRFLVALLLLLAAPAYAQQGQAVGPVSPCSAFGTASGTCLQGAGALGSPSSIGTLPAFTLGGTIAGGGNQLNNIIVGTTTPLAGSFTTLNATGATAVGTSGAALTVGDGITGAIYVTGVVGVGRANTAMMDNSSGTSRILATGANASTKGSWQFDVITSDFSSNLVTMSISPAGAIGMPVLASSSAAQTGTVCWTTGTGNLTVDTTTTCLLSAGKYKHDIRPLDGDSLAKVLALRPVSYEYNAELAIGGEQIGLIAEDVAAIDDRLVSHDPADGSVRAVRYQQLTAVLAGAIKELKADNDNLRRCQASWTCRIFGVGQ